MIVSISTVQTEVSEASFGDAAVCFDGSSEAE